MSSTGISNADEFLRGQRDCQQGVEHKTGQHPDYDRGYYAEYAMQEVISARAAYQESRHGN